MSIYQIAEAIRQVGLDPFMIAFNGVKDRLNEIRKQIYAYMSAGLPIIMCMNIVGRKRSENHAVTVTGFSLGRRPTVLAGDRDMLLRWSRIDEIYVHDDQIGPFSRMQMLDGATELLSTSWPNPLAGAQTTGACARPWCIVVPLYPKMRITYEKIIHVVGTFFTLMNITATKKPEKWQYAPPTKFEWDIRLTSLNDFKDSIASDPGIHREQKLMILRQSMPRFIWRTTILHGEDKLADILFDATECDAGKVFLNAFPYDLSFFRSVWSTSFEIGYAKESEIFKWFADQPKP